MSQKIKTSVEIDGSLSASQIQNATVDTDKFLVSDGGTVKYRTGAEMLSDLGVVAGTANHVQHQVKAGVAINKGQAVYVTGADGTNMIVGLASNSSEATSSKTMGLLNVTVSTNGFADVITEGLLAGLNTSAATVGDPIWLGTGGNLIYGLANKPYAPAHLVFIGIVTRVNANNGEIFVKVQNGFELNEIHDVDLKTTAPVGNDILAFEGAPVNLWKNKTIASVLGYTPYDASNPAGYISTYTETDPIYTASSWYSTVNNASNWNTAYGWGNHASAGYLTSVTNISGNAGTATQIYQDNEPVSGTYRLLLGNASDANGYVYNFNSLYFNKATNTIQGANVSGNAATATNADYANAAGTAGNLSGSINFATSGISAMKVNDTRYWVTDPNAPGNYFQALTMGNGSDFTQIGVNSSQEMYFRFNGSGNVWNTVLSSNNYSSFAVPNSRTITINGTSYDLSANRSWTVTASETDTLATVTGRGATTSTRVTLNSGWTVPDATMNYAGNFSTNDYSTMTFMSRAWQTVQGANGLAYVFNTHTNGGSGGYGALQIYYGESGYVYSPSSFRSPIFYDSNNTGYYIDPSSTSNLNLLTTANAATIGGILSIGNSTNTKIKWGGNTTPTLGLPFTGAANALWLEVNDGDTGGVVIDNEGVTVYGAGDTGYVFRVIDEDVYQSIGNVDASTTFYVATGQNGGGYMRGVLNVTDYLTAGNSSRAPIFYDSNNTGYYVDPASTSYINVLQLANKMIVGSFPQLQTNTGEAWIGRAADRNTGSLTVQLGGNSSSGRVFEVIDYAWTISLFNVTSAGNATAYGDITAYSDRRVKENINTIDDALNKVLSLRGVTYNRIDSEDKSEKIGVIAQEIQEVLPQVVHEQENGMLGVSYGNITAVLIEAIKEQQTQIEELKQLFNTLINK